jgi:hypothetical protein
MRTDTENTVVLGGTFGPKVKVVFPKLTKRRLKNYLAKNPNRLHACGDTGKCVIADYFSDKVKVIGDLPKDQEVRIHTGSAETYAKLVKVIDPKSDFVHSVYSSPYITHELWVNQVIQQFDRIRPGKRVRSTTVLRRLGGLLLK